MHAVRKDTGDLFVGGRLGNILPFSRLYRSGERRSMARKYELAVRGLDVKVVPMFVFGPWHSMMYGVYTRGGELLGFFHSYCLALDYILSEGHRVCNMMDVLLGAVDEMRLSREIREMYKMSI